jgi:hypothetical protein
MQQNPQAQITKIAEFKHSMIPAVTQTVLFELPAVLVLIVAIVLVSFTGFALILVPAVIFFVAMNLWIGLLLYNWTHSHYELTETSIIYVRNHLFAKYEDVLTINKNDDFQLRKEWVGKLFDYGTIAVSGPTVEGEFLIYNIKDPEPALDNLMRLVAGMKETSLLIGGGEGGQAQ